MDEQSNAHIEQSNALDGSDSANGDDDWQVTDSFLERSGSVDTATYLASQGKWQEDREVSSCPVCRIDFSATFRKHHCRMCGRVVCDDCSKNRMQLQSKPMEGKVRVCNHCVANQREQQATAYEEDTEARAEIVEQLKKELNKRYKESEVFKQVLLELDAEASDDTLLKEYYSDRETHAASFKNLQEKIEMRWEQLKQNRKAEDNSHQELRSSCQKSELRLGKSREHLELLKQQKASMIEDFTEFDKMQKDTNDLTLKESRLREALKDARKRVQDLEQQRQDSMAQQRSRWGVGRLSRAETQAAQNSSSPSASFSSADNEAFTITHGQSDTYGTAQAGSNRRCAIM